MHSPPRTIGWLVQRTERARGRLATPTLPHAARDPRRLFARWVQPDPSSPDAPESGSSSSARRTSISGIWKPGDLVLCEVDLQPLSTGNGYSLPAGGRGRRRFFAATEPFTPASYVFPAPADPARAAPLPRRRFLAASTAAANGACRAQGQRLQRDRADRPVGEKLVAYDSAGRVVGLQVLPGPSLAAACPALRVAPTAGFL